MIDVKQQLVTVLSGILPTYYELFCDSSTTMPCITYRESNNYDHLTGNTLGYSYVRYDIKVWGKVISDLSQYVQRVDRALNAIGYTRVTYQELTVNDNIECIMVYEGLALEDIN